MLYCEDVFTKCFVHYQAPGESGATFFGWDDFQVIGPIAFDAAILRSSLNIPQGSHVLKVTQTERENKKKRN
jgi:hypothetical protein